MCIAISMGKVLLVAVYTHIDVIISLVKASYHEWE